jgi:hypothetical protein
MRVFIVGRQGGIVYTIISNTRAAAVVGGRAHVRGVRVGVWGGGWYLQSMCRIYDLWRRVVWWCRRWGGGGYRKIGRSCGWLWYLKHLIHWQWRGMGDIIVRCGARWTETALCRTLGNQQWARRGDRRWDGCGYHSGYGGRHRWWTETALCRTLDN